MALRPKENRYLPALAMLLLITLGATGWLVYTIGSKPAERPISMLALVDSQAASLQANLALEGNQGAFDDLKSIAAKLDVVAAARLTTQQKIELDKVKAGIATITKGREELLGMRLAINRLQERVPSFSIAIDEFQATIPKRQKVILVAQSERMRLLANSLLSQMQTLLAGNGAELARQTIDIEMELQQLAQAFESGDPALGFDTIDSRQSKSALSDVTRRASQLGGAVRDALGFNNQVQGLHQARRKIESAARAMELSKDQMDAAAGNPILSVEFDRIFVLMSASAFLVLVMLALWTRGALHRRKSESEDRQSEGDQAAILRLLDELERIADGDLTVQATVGEDVTGAIADSINYTIEALRELVGTINNGAILLEDVTKQTEASARALAIASKSQSKQVKNASSAVRQMVASIDEVSGDAERSSDVARHSVDVAHKGGEAVRRTIAGMNTIRETIQETSKRIKRLGESSQEIGDIVELINDIADQTNILALNASIQASMAGEAGRGFAVVADEVQRLAERSANATRRIEVLVSTIQADTNEAVVSMERSTTDVVGGALLAENAGAALEEIEQVSNQIAMLVQNISGSARDQNDAAKTVLENVEKLTDISRKAEKSASITSKFINKLSALATQLRMSVAGFVLPGDKESFDEGVVEQEVSLAGQEVPLEERKPVVASRPEMIVEKNIDAAKLPPNEKSADEKRVSDKSAV
jgi:twitching motility protein PilJ